MASSWGHEQQARVAGCSLALGREAEVSECFIGVLSVHAAVFQPTGLTAGVCGPPSAAEVLHIPRVLTGVLHTWCLDTYKNVANHSEKNNFTLN